MSRDNLMPASFNAKKDLKKAGEKKVKKDEKSKKEKDVNLTGSKNLENTKDLKNLNGWNHSWAVPKRIYLKGGLEVRDVVPGPFISPRLVRVTPFVLNSTNQVRKVNRIRRGIPDAWAEYLAVNGLGSEVDQEIIEKELNLGYNNLRVTDFVWNELGLPLTQGIPDPWKPVLSEYDFSLGDERADICLCNPRERGARKVKHKLSIRKDEKSRQNFEPYKISEQVPKDKNKYKSRKKIKCACNKNFLPKNGTQNQSSQSLQASNNFIQCDISGKITLHTQQGNSFDGIGSLKLNCGQNGNYVCGEQEKGNQFLPDFVQNIRNQFAKTSKIRDIVSNFEPAKQLSKLKKIFHGKNRNQIEKYFGEETKLVCCKCSCPYFKLLSEETLDSLNKPYSDSKTQTKNKSDRKTYKKRCELSNCKKNKKKNHSEKKMEKEKITENLKHVTVTQDEKEVASPDDKFECGCKIKHEEGSIDSGNNADISDYSKNDDQSFEESVFQSVTSLTYMTRLNEKSSEKLRPEIRNEKKKGTCKKRNLCSPCGKKPKILQNDVTSDLTEEFPNQKEVRRYSGARKFESEPICKNSIETVQNIEDRQRSVSYATKIVNNDQQKFENKTSISENQILERKKTSDLDRIFEEKNIENYDLLVENLSNNSNDESFITRENKNSRKCSQNDCRKRGGGMGTKFWSSDSEPDKRETRKSAWCEEENKADSFRKISDQDRSDMKLDNRISSKVFSSLLEESLDLISEPIGRRKSSENFQISEEQSLKKENKCYVKYCYDHTQKYNWE